MMSVGHCISDMMMNGLYVFIDGGCSIQVSMDKDKQVCRLSTNDRR